jgi:hypothetical protein
VTRCYWKGSGLQTPNPSRYFSSAGQRFRALSKPLARLRHEVLFLPERDPRCQDASAQEDKVGVEDVVEAVVVDLLQLPFGVQGGDLIPSRVHLSRLPEHLGEEVEAGRGVGMQPYSVIHSHQVDVLRAKSVAEPEAVRVVEVALARHAEPETPTA